jgi:hypothetical protein
VNPEAGYLLHLLIRKARAVENGATRGATYKVVVRGELDSRFAYLFNGMHMEQVEGTTVLSGKVIDQAQLHGFIERIEELGLELLSLRQTSEPRTERGSV